MQLPREEASLSVYRRYTAYTVRRLRRAKMAVQATDAQNALTAVKDAQGAVEDAEEPYEEALADRDAADDALDACAEEISRDLGSRKPDAKQSSPWKDVFPDTAAYYTASPVGEQKDRYNKLADRVKAHLPATDRLVTEVVPRILQGIQDFTAADEAGKAALRTLETRRADRERAEAAWRRLMDRIYSAIRAEHGRAAAEKFFKAPSRGGKKQQDTPEA